MPWFKVDDGLHSHPKAIEAGLEAMGLWVLLGSHCGFYVGQRGRVARASAIRIAGSARTLARCAERLVVAGFWEADGDGWRFHDWHVYQPTPEAIEAEHFRKSEAGKAGAAARAAAKALAEREADTKRTRSEHEVSTVRARTAHEVSTTTTRNEHDNDAAYTRPEGSTARDDSGQVQQPLATCSTDSRGTAVARPVPSRPDPREREREAPQTEPSRARPKRSSVGTRLPPEWGPSDSLLAWAKSKGIINADVAQLAENFRDHWLAADHAGALKVDWDAAFRTWVRRDIESGKVRAVAPVATVAVLPPPTPEQTATRRATQGTIAAAIAEMNANAAASRAASGGST